MPKSKDIAAGIALVAGIVGVAVIASAEGSPAPEVPPTVTETVAEVVKVINEGWDETRTKAQGLLDESINNMKDPPALVIDGVLVDRAPDIFKAVDNLKNAVETIKADTAAQDLQKVAEDLAANARASADRIAAQQVAIQKGLDLWRNFKEGV